MARIAHMIDLSSTMIAALIDIDLNYIGPDSFRHLPQTQRALERRGLVTANARRLTAEGRDFMPVLRRRYKTFAEFDAATRDERKAG